MDKIIEKIKDIKNINELKLPSDVDQNQLFTLILKAHRYDLLNYNNISIKIGNDTSSIELIEYLLSDEDVLYYLYNSGYAFQKETLNDIFKVIYEKYRDSYKFDCFFRYFFNKDSLNNFIKDHESFFKNFLENSSYIPYILKDSDSFIELILKGKYISHISNIDSYSLTNLKLLASLIKTEKKLNIPYYFGNERFAEHLFNMKSSLEDEELYNLLYLLTDKSLYNRKTRKSQNGIFEDLVNENIEYLINIISESGIVPQCLVESITFREECIKQGKINLAVQCLLPENIFQDEKLANLYCQELKIELKDFYSRGKRILDYYEKNNNIFNSLVSTTLKDEIFTIDNIHLERFINDVSIQMLLAKLNTKEIEIFREILKHYNYEKYDISFMMTNILNNIEYYSELVNSIDLPTLTESDIKNLISVLQISPNQYKISDINDLRNYKNKKKEYFEINYSKADINLNKDNLLKMLFNINLYDASIINQKFCYNRNKNVLDDLSKSELPKSILEYLIIINKIIESNNKEELLNFYNRYRDNEIYKKEIPLETYLRSIYTSLYSSSLYKIEEKENTYGPQDTIFKSTNFNNHNIKICIPREKFNFLVHCVGSCSLSEDSIDTNYQNDWENRPQIQDHFVACSYINELGLYSIRSKGSIIYGFDEIENGALFGMGDTDIDSIGNSAKKYSPSKNLMEENGNRANYFIPSLLLESINKGYNEIVLERRNYNSNKKNHFKRSPDYIIMMSDSLDKDNFTYLSDLFENKLSFVSYEDRELIRTTSEEKNIKKILNKYREIITEQAIIQNVDEKSLMNYYLSLIVKSKYYEDCLKAASEFDIPLVIIDKEYYFYKLLSSSDYSESEKNNIASIYKSSKEDKKKTIFNIIATGSDLTPIFAEAENKNFVISV